MGQEVTKDRQSVRASVALTARYADPVDARQHEGICQNLSRSGMFLGTPRAAAVGAVLKLECELLDGTGRIRGVARVRWLRREADGGGRPAGMGLRFLNLESGAAQLIEDVLARGDIGTSGRRARSDPPDERRDSQRPRLVAVHTMRGIGMDDRSPSSNPPAARKSRDAGELRERWKDVRRTRHGFAASGAEQPTSSTPPPPDGELEKDTFAPILPPPAPIPSEAKVVDSGDPVRTTEPGPHSPSPAKPGRRDDVPEPSKADAAPEPDRPDDPEWRVARLAELVEAEAKTQRDALERKTPASEPLVEEGVLVGRISKLQLPGARFTRIAVGLLVVAAIAWWALARKAPSDTALASPARIVLPAPRQEPRKAEAVMPAPLPRGLDVPRESVESPPPSAAGITQPAPSTTSRTSPSSASASKPRASSARRDSSSSAPPPPVTPAPAPLSITPSAPPAEAEAPPARSPLATALQCLQVGDSACAVRALEGKAKTAQELELLIESYRALGNTAKVDDHMRSYLERFPSGKMVKAYQRLLQYQTTLEHAEPAGGKPSAEAPAAAVPRVAPPPAEPVPSSPF